MRNRLAGQVAWISGGASGIGAATAKLFAGEGASVVVADVRDEDGEQLVDRINSAGGKAVYLVVQRRQQRSGVELDGVDRSEIRRPEHRR